MFTSLAHKDVMMWNHFQCHWPFVRWKHQPSVVVLTNDHQCEALVGYLLLSSSNCCTNSRIADDSETPRLSYVSYDIITMRRFTECIHRAIGKWFSISKHCESFHDSKLCLPKFALIISYTHCGDIWILIHALCAANISIWCHTCLICQRWVERYQTLLFYRFACSFVGDN